MDATVDVVAVEAVVETVTETEVVVDAIVTVEMDVLVVETAMVALVVDAIAVMVDVVLAETKSQGTSNVPSFGCTIFCSVKVG